MLENGQLQTLNMRDILPNRFQPRMRFNEEKLNELADSIRKYGLIQPIIVRQIGNKYEIIAGERRFKASALANKETIPAIVVSLSDRDSEEIALLENIQREDLTPIEEAVSYKRILDVGYITQEELARKIGKSQSAIANKIRLLSLDDIVQDALLRGKISERHARSLLKIHNSDKQVYMLNRIINERLTVKRTDNAIRDLLESEGEAKKIDSNEAPVKVPTEPTSPTQKPVRPAVPVASHRIIKVNPPKELEEKLKEKNQNINGRRNNFMDIDKILAEAQDITPNEQPKPANDIADLMKQNPETATSPIIKSEPEVSETQVSPIEPGKFVGPVIKEEPVQETPEPINQGPVTFDSIFNQTPIQSQAAPAVQTSQATQPSTPINPNLVEPAIETPSVPIAPVVAPSAPEVLTIERPVTPTPVQTPAEPISPIQTPAMPEPQVTPQQMPSAIQPTPEPVIQEAPTIPVSPVSPAPMPTPVQPINQNTATMNIPDDNIIEPAPVQNNIANFRQVINLIRNCADEIERLGYYIDVDEIDLNNQYQVTFKIDKE